MGIFAGSIDIKPEEQSLKRLAATSFGAGFVPTPDGNGIVLFQRESTLFSQNFNVSRLEFTGEIRKLAEHVGNTRAYGYFAGSPNVLIHRGGSGNLGQLTWFDREGKRLGTAGQQFGMDSAPDISRDGSRIALSTTLGDHSDVWVHDISRDVIQRITYPALNQTPIWSPDGRRIVLSSGRAGQYDLYQIDAAGGNEKLLYKSRESKRATSWSADGRYLLYNAQAAKYGIWLLRMEGEVAPQPIGLTTGRFNQRDGVFSPDAKWIAYVSDESGAGEVYLQSFSAAAASLENGPKVLISRGGGTRPRWRADGKELFYRASNGRLMSVALSTSPLQPSVPKSLFWMEGARWDPTPDGKRFLIVVPMDKALQPFTVVLNWQNEGNR